MFYEKKNKAEASFRPPMTEKNAQFAGLQKKKRKKKTFFFFSLTHPSNKANGIA
jgi:hypothetical protein